jgi:hypothetical protein
VLKRKEIQLDGSFSVSPTSLSIGGKVDVSFTIKNVADYSLDIQAFVGCRDPEGQNRDFGHTTLNLAPNDTKTILGTLTVDKEGTWRLWAAWSPSTRMEPQKLNGTTYVKVKLQKQDEGKAGDIRLIGGFNVSPTSLTVGGRVNVSFTIKNVASYPINLQAFVECRDPQNRNCDFGHTNLSLGPSEIATISGALTVNKEGTWRLWAVWRSPPSSMEFHRLSGEVQVRVRRTQNRPPIADAGPDMGAEVGDRVDFDGSGSFDPDGRIVAARWDFGDGSSTG